MAGFSVIIICLIIFFWMIQGLSNLFELGIKDTPQVTPPRIIQKNLFKSILFELNCKCWFESNLFSKRAGWQIVFKINVSKRFVLVAKLRRIRNWDGLDGWIIRGRCDLGNGREVVHNAEDIDCFLNRANVRRNACNIRLGIDRFHSKQVGGDHRGIFGIFHQGIRRELARTFQSTAFLRLHRSNPLIQSE